MKNLDNISVFDVIDNVYSYGEQQQDNNVQ